jgi:hypothetical protein
MYIDCIILTGKSNPQQIKQRPQQTHQHRRGAVVSNGNDSHAPVPLLSLVGEPNPVFRLNRKLQQ